VIGAEGQLVIPITVHVWKALALCSVGLSTSTAKHELGHWMFVHIQGMG